MSNDHVRKRLTLVYEEIMWLAKRENVTASAARAWYTHVAAVALKTHIRRFTGLVSSNASLDLNTLLRLEHFKRIQTSLTSLVARHCSNQLHDPTEFIDHVLDSEQVHIVTMAENYAVMRTKGDYSAADVQLLDWSTLSSERQFHLWKSMLRGKVANAVDFKPAKPK